MIGPICGVVAGVLVLALLTGLLVWRRKRGAVQTITMRQLIEDGEARGTLLEENEVGQVFHFLEHKILIWFSQFNSNMPVNEEHVDRVLVNSLP